MSEIIGVSMNSEGEDGVNKLVLAVENLEQAVMRLGTVNLGSGLAQQFSAMQTQMTAIQESTKSSFLSLEYQMKDFDTKVRREREQSLERQAQTEAKAAKKLAEQQDTIQAGRLGSYVKMWEQVVATQVKAEEASAALSWKNMLELEERQKASNARYQALVEKRDAEMHAAQVKTGQEYVALWEKMLAERQAIQERRDLELHGLREREYADYTGWWSKTLAKQEAAQAKQRALAQQQQVDLLRIQAAGEEKQRTLNTSFLTSPLKSQISTAEQAAVYSSLGGNAAEKYGGAAAAANLASLRAQYEALPASVRKSQNAIEEHNHAMQEAHAFARGLSGSLGGLWMTYGSLVPLAAGAAIAASLKGIVDVGKDVEYQLQFVAALSREAVPLDSFLAISAGTVVGVKDAAEGMRALAQNGLSVKESLQVLPEVLNLAVVGELGVEAAALAATGALSAFGLHLSDIGRVGDILAQTAASSNTSVKALTESLKQASIASSLYHVSIEDTAAALGTLAKINITGAAAGTAYNNFLTSMYAPTQQGAKALKQLGVEAQNADGSLKDVSLLMHQLRDALSGYNETAKAAFIGDITTNRGAKAIATLLRYLKEYDDNVEAAKKSTGFMSDAVIKLEDTTEGAFRRLKNSSAATLARAFDDVSPALQRLVDGLAGVARSEGAVRLLSNLATVAVSVTQGVVNNGTAILTLVGLYGALAIGVAVWRSLAVAAEAYSVGIAAATTMTAAFGVTMRGVMATLGPIGLTITAATIAWAALNHETDTTTRDATKLENSIRTRIELLQNETEALEKRNAEAQRGLKGGTDPSTASEAMTRVTGLQMQYDLVKRAADKATETNAAVMFAGERWSPSSLVMRSDKLKRQLEDARKDLTDLQATQERYRKGKEEETTQGGIASLGSQSETFDKSLEVYRAQMKKLGKEDQTQGDEFKDLWAKKNAAVDGARKGAVSLADAQADLNILQDTYNKLLQARPKDPSNVDLRTMKEQMELTKNLETIRRKSEEVQLHADHDAGRIGDIEYLREKLALEKDALAQAALTALDEAKSVEDVEKKKDAYAKYNRLLLEAVEKSRQATLQESIAEQTYYDGLTKANLATEAETYAKRGDLLNAFLTKFESDNATTISRLQADLAKVDVNQLREATELDPSSVRKLQEYNNALQLQLRLRNLLKLEQAGTDDAAFGGQKKDFDAGFAVLKEKLAEAKAAAEADGGISGAMGLQEAANTLRKDFLPNLELAVIDMKALAEALGDADMAKKASEAGSALQKLSLDLNKSANSFGNMWNDVWKGIEHSAHDAWMHIGEKGESVFKSIGKVIKSSIMEMLYQLTIKKWLISIGASISGMGEAQSLASMVGGGSSAPGGSGLLGDVSSALSVYKLASGGNMSTAFGASSAGQFYSGFSGSAAAASEALGAPMTGAAAAGNWAANGLSGTAGAPYLGMAGGGLVAYNVAQNHGALAGAAAGAGTIAAGGAVSGMAAGTGAMAGASSALIAVPGWGWAALAALAVLGSMDKGPEQHTRLTFNSNNTPGAISINERGNEGKSDQSYIDGSGKGAFGTFGLSSTFWSPGNSETVQTFIQAVAKTDDALASFLTTQEKAAATSAVTGHALTANLGAEGTAQNAAGELDAIFAQRLNLIFEGVSPGLSKLIEGFKGTGQELTAEATSILAFRSALDASSISIYGAKVTLQDLADLKNPTESVATALSRIQKEFQVTDQVATALGKTMAEAFGTVGLSSLAARENLIVLAGGADTLSAQISSFAQNYLTEAEKLAPVSKAMDAALGSLGLASVPKTRQEFKDLALSLDLTDAAQAKVFTSLLSLQDAFATLHPAIEDVAETAKKAADAAAEAAKAAADQIVTDRKSLQDQLDAFLPASGRQAKERAALDETNRSLYDQVEAHKALQEAYDSEKQTLEDLVTKSDTFATSMRKFGDSLKLGNLSPLTPQQKYMEAKSQYQATLKAARTGDAGAQGDLESKAQAFLEASQVANASSAAYVADFNQVSRDTAESVQWAQAQVDIGKASLVALNAQVTGLLDLKTEVMNVSAAILQLGQAIGGPEGDALIERSGTAALSKLYEQLLGRAPDEAGLAYWLGVLKGGHSITEIGAAIGSGPESRTSNITGLYQSVLGRAPDAAGLDYWASQVVNQGISIDDIRHSMMLSDEYKGTKTGTRAGGAVPAGYAGMVDNSVLVAKIEAMTQELAKLRAEQAQQVADQILAQFTATDLAATKTGELTEAAMSSAAWQAANSRELVQ